MEDCRKLAQAFVLADGIGLRVGKGSLQWLHEHLLKYVEWSSHRMVSNDRGKLLGVLEVDEMERGTHIKCVAPRFRLDAIPESHNT